MQETRVHVSNRSATGPQVPGYRIVRVLGSGGMASVYLAVQESLEREVALKVMSPQLAADPEFTQRFLKEGKITARLAHRNLVTVYDIGSHQGVYYLAAEYIAGGTLRERMNAGLRIDEILDIVAEVARGLHFAHGKGVVHRDIKPSNILFKADGTVVLADFGIAKALDSSSTSTMAGASIGTPDYMSPEQARGEPVDGRADLYALGVMLYEMLIGRPPFDGSDPFAVALAHLTQPVPILPSEFEWLQPVLNRLMAKRPEDRFDTGEAVAAELVSLRERIPKAQGTRVVRHDTAKRRAIESAATVPLADGTTRLPALAGRGRAIAIAGLAVLIVAGGLGLWALGSRDADTERETSLPQLPNPGADLSEAESLLVQAQAYLDYGFQSQTLGRRLTFPEDDSAVGLFRRVLELEPGNAEAQAGLARIGDFYLDAAGKLCERAHWEACATSARDGLMAQPDSQALATLLERAQSGARGD